MELQIEKARDEWIRKFKNKWDVQIQKMVAEKNAAVAELSRDHTAKIKALKKSRDQQIKDIQLEFSDSIDKLKVDVDEKKASIEKKYTHKLSQFLTANLKQPTMYDSICSYILYFKSAIFQEQVMPSDISSDYPPEEPQIITFQDITDLQYVEPYPLAYERCTDGVVVGPFQVQQRETVRTKKEITHTETFTEKNVKPLDTKNRGQSFSGTAKKIYTEPGTAPLSDEQYMYDSPHPFIASAPPSYETVSPELTFPQ